MTDYGRVFIGNDGAIVMLVTLVTSRPNTYWIMFMRSRRSSEEVGSLYLLYVDPTDSRYWREIL